MKRALLLAAVTVAALLPALPASAQSHHSRNTRVGSSSQHSRNPRVGSSSHRRGHSRGYYRRPRFSFGFGGYWGWGGWYGPPYSYYGYGYPYGYGYYGGPHGYYPSADWAAIDTDVAPEEAKVYLDGALVGSADDFDGFPDYLYLKRGRYRLEFRLEGYEPKSVEIDARPGMKLHIDESLRKIPGAKQYGSYEPAIPEGSVRRFYAKRRDAAAAVDDEDEIYGAVPDRRERYREDDRDDDEDEADTRKADADDEGDDEDAAERPRDRRGVRSDDWRSGRGEQREENRDGARLRVEAEPADAVVFVDDRFVGTAKEIGSLSRGISVAPGKHTVTVSRPGYKDRTVEISVDAGETEEVSIELSR
jgi:PEGA domain-containing protein